MMNFDDLNDEIGADDWLIPKREITRRKLIKRTSRFKIYKADWFGDVLVYEPIKQDLASRRQMQKATSALESAPKKQQHESSSSSSLLNAFNQEAFSSKLNELCLDLKRNNIGGERTPLASKKLAELEQPEQGVDSAYSSISSTPQYHTKHNMSHEFSFPSSGVVDKQEMGTRLDNGEQVRVGAQQQQHSACNSRKSTCLSPPVILNRDSFEFAPQTERHAILDDNDNDDVEKANCTTRDNNDNVSQQITAAAAAAAASAVVSSTSSSGAWFELNELRLVAHENFMLFMGASLSEEDVARVEQNASLVMQMSHPKSISLHNLLHGNCEQQQQQDYYTFTNGSCCNGYSSTSTLISSHHHHHHHQRQLSPRERFFSARHQRESSRPHLTVDAKLNICQQVTNAMTYLHDKNIVHGRLTSVNIYIEKNQRVKISLLDNDEQQIVQMCDDQLQQQQQQVARFNLPALTYLSPELIRTIKVTNCDDKRQLNVGMETTSKISKEADIFSFGTLLFELFEQRFPFAAPTAASSPAHSAQDASLQSPSRPASPVSPEARLSANTKLFDTLCLELSRSPSRLSCHFQQVKQQSNSGSSNIKASACELIYKIGSGQIAALNERSTDVVGACPPLVDHIISACWATEANARPSFKQLKFE